MRIKKLEIAGFKSFVDRTVIHFDEDVVGVVGPNGCGKSNIVDSIRWCMGEQSARHLRGRAMSDVIFSGSETRSAHGLAEVTLTFDNTDPEGAQGLPLEYRDYSEIAVTRRLFRDGTSEYLINKTQVRLKDITDLFLGTGVGTKAYSIIEQGKIGLIVSAKPEDRRMLIEEAAGITKYKARKKQAEQKMELTRQNLLRVGDIVSEIQRSLASLKRQAAKAERYVSYRKELEDLTLHEAAHKLLELIVLAQVAESARMLEAEQSQAARASLDAREAELEVVRQRSLDAESAAEQAQSASHAADGRVREHEATFARSRDRLAHLDGRREAAGREQEDLERTIGELKLEREGLLAELERFEEEEAREADVALDEHDRLDELRRTQQAAEQDASTLRRQVASASASVAGAEATLSGFERRTSEMSQRRNRLEDEMGRLDFEVEEVEARRIQLAQDVAELAEGKRMSSDARVELDAELKALREQTVQTDRAVDSAKNELNQKRSRLRALEDLHARLEGVGTGVKNLLQTKDPALAGLVADRIEAPAELTQAFAGLLGGQLQSVVVRDPERGLALLGELSRGKRGRATLIPERPRLASAGSAAIVPQGEGVIGRLLDRLHFAPDDAALAESLVGDAVIVESAEVGLRLLRESEFTPTLVTLDGTVLYADGRISGGAGDAVAAGMIEQKREMRELHEWVEQKSGEVTALLEAQQAQRLRLGEVQTALDRARNEAHQGELALVTAEKDLRRAEEQRTHGERRRETVRADLEELLLGIENARYEADQAREKLEQGKSAHEDLGASLAQAEALASEWAERAHAQQAIVSERKVRIARVRERASGTKNTVERLGRSCEELSARIAKLDDERTECAYGAGQAAALIMSSRADLGEAVGAARAAEQALLEARVALDEARLGLSQRDAELRQLRQDVGSATERLRQHEMELQRIAIERTHLVEGVRERFRGLELPTILGDFHKRAPVGPEHRERIVELTGLIDRMGPVNVDAVREHEEAEKRHAYYAEQKADLDRAIADLEKAIAQMNRESKRLFRSTFDGINARFKMLFPKMFRGGQAELRLTNPDDMLETGIEILAQPPGKKLGNIELMSGGEKALTAVSLIFAIFQFKPSPFCILDEVDAPLDEANVTRYNEAIRGMTDHSQFILITHIKRTMQSVDVLYGVTMQEPGVSKLVSVRIGETSERRKKAAEQSAAAAAEGAVA